MTLRRLLALQALLAAMAGLLMLVSAPASLQRFWLDLQLRLAAPAQSGDGVLLIDIDEASLQHLSAEFGAWPLSRDSYAVAVEALRAAGARAVVINLQLSDARAGDDALTRAMAQPGSPVLLAATGVPAMGEAQPVDAWRWAQLSGPHAALGAKANTVGMVSTPLDSDGQLREIVLQHQAPNQQLPWLSLQLLQHMQLPQRLQATPQGRVTPLFSSQGPPRFALSTLLRAAREADQPQQVLLAARHQIVFIGAVPPLGDGVVTAAGQLDGHELLAQSYLALRDGKGLQALSSPGQLGLLGLALLPALLALLSQRSQLKPVLLASALVLLLLAGLLVLLPRQHGLWLDASAALCTLLTASLLQALAHQHALRSEAQHQALLRNQADENYRAKSAFLANISHELRTPLSAMLGLTELLQHGQLNAEQRRQVQLMGDSGHALLGLVDELLDLSRIETERLHLNPAPWQLASLLKACIEQVQARTLGRTVQLELKMDEQLPPWVQVDGRRLQQVLRNLLGNAIKFTTQGQVQLQARLASDGSGGIEFSVSDTGIGIASSQLQRIFEPSVQSPLGEAPRHGGPGLGLAISRQLVRLMGNDIDVHSVPGAGSRFAFTLALAGCAAPADQEAVAPLADPKGLHVLLAEDDEVLAEVLASQLRQLGLQVERAANGHLALALARRMRFDGLLLDLGLPGLDGAQVLHGLRDHERQQGLAALPVIALSALPEGEAQDPPGGYDAVLRLPISSQSLREALARWASRSVNSHGANAAPEPATTPHPAPGPEPEADPKRAHALVFLGRFGQAWTVARDDRVQRLALLDDLLRCADAIADTELGDCVRGQLSALQRVPVSMQAMQKAEKALRDGVEAALVGLHRGG